MDEKKRSIKKKENDEKSKKNDDNYFLTLPPGYIGPIMPAPDKDLNLPSTAGCYSTHLGAVAPSFENHRSRKVLGVRGSHFRGVFFGTKAASASSIQHNTAIPSS